MKNPYLDMGPEMSDKIEKIARQAGCVDLVLVRTILLASFEVYMMEVEDALK